MTASHSSFIEVPSTGLQVCVCGLVRRQVVQREQEGGRNVAVRGGRVVRRRCSTASVAVSRRLLSSSARLVAVATVAAARAAPRHCTTSSSVALTTNSSRSDSCRSEAASVDRRPTARTTPSTTPTTTTITLMITDTNADRLLTDGRLIHINHSYTTCIMHKPITLPAAIQRH